MLKNTAVSKIKDQQNGYGPKHRMGLKCTGNIQMQQTYIGTGHSAARAWNMEKVIHRTGNMKQAKQYQTDGENAAGKKLVL